MKDKPFNYYSNYGVSLDNLSTIFQTPPKSDLRIDNYNLSEKLFYGFNRIEDLSRNIGIPNKILQNMTPPEIIAMYAGIGRYNKPIDQLENTELPNIVSKLVQAGFEYPAIRKIKYLDRINFGSEVPKSGDLIKRMDNLDDMTKKISLYILFDKNRRVSNVENNEVFDFRDPNYEGNIDHTATKIYINYVIDCFRKKYINNKDSKIKENNFEIPKKEKKIIKSDKNKKTKKGELCPQYLKFKKDMDKLFGRNI